MSTDTTIYIEPDGIYEHVQLADLLGITQHLLTRARRDGLVRNGAAAGQNAVEQADARECRQLAPTEVASD